MCEPPAAPTTRRSFRPLSSRTSVGAIEAVGRLFGCMTLTGLPGETDEVSVKLFSALLRMIPRASRCDPKWLLLVVVMEIASPSASTMLTLLVGSPTSVVAGSSLTEGAGGGTPGGAPGSNGATAGSRE